MKAAGKKRGGNPNPWADHYTRRARREHYAARSVFKLQEIQKKYGLMRPGQRVLDLGCAPGSWLQYAARVVGPRGRVVGLDLRPVTCSLPSQARALTGDINDLDDDLRAALGGGFHVVLSDMAPATTGSRIVDAARSYQLCEMALDTAGRLLQPGGAFVCKIFQGGDFDAFRAQVQRCFDSCRIFKPRSSRKASREIYLIGLGKRQEETCPDTASGQP